MMDDNLITLKMSVQGTEKDIKYIKDDLKKTSKLNRSEHDAIKVILEKHLQHLDERCKGKANVWVEKALMWIAITVGGAIIASAMKLLLV